MAIKLQNIPRPSERLIQTVENIELHSHVCLIYRDKAEGLASATAFILAGLRNNDRCVYVTDDHSSEEITRELVRKGIDVETEIKKGRLIIATKQESYLDGGSFDPDKAIGFFADASKVAVKDGFRAIRGAAEMTWQLGGDPGTERLLEYESKMNESLFPVNQVVGLCQFNLQRFSPEVIREVLYTHPIILIGGLVCKNFFYKPPQEYIANEAEDGAEREVQRMLESIYEFEKNELELRTSKQALKDANEDLEKRVTERTSLLEAKTKQLKAANALMAGREYRIRELEDQKNALEMRLDIVMKQLHRKQGK